MCEFHFAFLYGLLLIIFQDVVFYLQQYFERDVDPPLPSELLDRGNFSIFVDGVDKKDLGSGLIRTAAPSAFPRLEDMGPPPMSDAMQRYMAENAHAFQQPMQIQAMNGYVNPGSARSSLDIDMQNSPFVRPLIQSRTTPGIPGPNGMMYPGHSPASSMGSITRINLPGVSDHTAIPAQIGSRPSTSSGQVPITATTTSPVAASPSTSVSDLPSGKKFKPSYNYSWNEVVDRENLGVRPGEVEILSKDFEVMYA